MRSHNKRPSVADWQAALPRLKPVGGQLQGACPACGGDDRFHVTLRGGLYHCRHGCSSEEMLRGAGLWRESQHRSRSRWPAHSTPPIDHRIATRDGSGANEAQPSARGSTRHNRTEGAQDSDSRPLAASVWKLGREVQGAAAGTYLERRGVFLRPRTTRPCARWLTKDAAQQAAPGLPADADGAIAYRLRWPSSEPALQLDAITAAGRATEPRWRRSVGATASKVMVVRGNPDWPLIIAEGPIDALSLATWTGCSCLATGGASTMGNAALHRKIATAGRTVLICADGDSAGRAAATAMTLAIRERGGTCRIQWTAGGSDPAAILNTLLDANDRRRRMRERWTDALQLAEQLEADPESIWIRQWHAWHRRLESGLPSLAVALRTAAGTERQEGLNR